MKKLYKYLALSPLFLGMSGGLTSCSNSSVSDKFTLKIINSEDYIYLDDEDPRNNMTEQFKRYVKKLAKDGLIDHKFINVDVVYDTSDTNETLYSELQTGKSDYDLINVSDYMAQKMVTEELIVPLYDEEHTREEWISNYETYASPVLRDRLDSIAAPNKNPKISDVKFLEDYAVGYMWGTLGILFNPGYSAYSKIGEDEVLNDMHYSFSSLWNKRYKRTISIKNSMRDTFAAGLMHAYESDFIELDRMLEAGEISSEEYLSRYSLLFNGQADSQLNPLSFSNVVNNVHKSLNKLKNNIFGLEVDSGKQDIVTGKIGINLAWSGDAVYSMDQAEDGNLVGENQSTLYYCVPELGSNLWFDTWVMPKNSNRSQERYELALMFLDFMSAPENAMQNMDYTGYTPFIGGAEVLDLVRDWYDIRTDEIFEEVEIKKYNYEYYQVYGVKDSSFIKLGYDDCMTFNSGINRGHKEEYNSYDLYYFVPTDDLEEPASVSDILSQNHRVHIKDIEGEPTEDFKTYGDLLIADSEENRDELSVDLSYFFNNTLVGSDYIDSYDTVFYSDSYYADPFADEEEYGEHAHLFHHTLEDGEVVYHENNSIGRQFFAQYPDEETINRCAVMKDFGKNNKLVMSMWEEFKSDPLPVGGVIIFVIIIASAVGLVGVIVLNKILTNKIRKKRKMAQK